MLYTLLPLVHLSASQPDLFSRTRGQKLRKPEWVERVPASRGVQIRDSLLPLELVHCTYTTVESSTAPMWASTRAATDHCWQIHKITTRSVIYFFAYLCLVHTSQLQVDSGHCTSLSLLFLRINLACSEPSCRASDPPNSPIAGSYAVDETQRDEFLLLSSIETVSWHKPHTSLRFGDEPGRQVLIRCAIWLVLVAFDRTAGDVYILPCVLDRLFV